MTDELVVRYGDSIGEGRAENSVREALAGERTLTLAIDSDFSLGLLPGTTVQGQPHLLVCHWLPHSLVVVANAFIIRFALTL